MSPEDLDRDPAATWVAVGLCHVAGPAGQPHYGCRMGLASRMPAVSVHGARFEHGSPSRWHWVVYHPETNTVAAHGTADSEAAAWRAADGAALTAGWRLA